MADAEGSFFQYQGVRRQLEGDIVTAMQFYKLAVDKYNDALTSAPSNKEVSTGDLSNGLPCSSNKILRNLAICMFRMHTLSSTDEFSPAHMQVRKMDQLFLR